MSGLDIFIINSIKNFLTPIFVIQGIPIGLILIGGECIIALFKIMDIKIGNVK